MFEPWTHPTKNRSSRNGSAFRSDAWARSSSSRKDGNYGFIVAEDYREDVFFHTSNWNGQVTTDGKTRNVPLAIDLWVEFELDDEQFETDQRLRAKVVRPTTRPIGRKLSGRDATFEIVTHHPRARRKRPTWRDK